MKVRVIAGNELGTDAGLLRRWRQIQETTPALASPYFCPEYTLACAAARDDVRVGVMEDSVTAGAGGGVVGFFPFQRGPLGFGRPVGGPLSDAQAVIVGEAEGRFDARDLVRACGLAAWDFDHLIASQRALAPFHRASASSPVLELPEGYEAWAAARKAAGSEELAGYARKGRKLAREVGPLRYTHHDADSAMLDRVIALKREQYARTGVPDALGHDWSRRFLRAIHAMRDGDRAGEAGEAGGGGGWGFAGVLSTLHAGDRLAAAHLGMRSATVWHWWFPVYDAELSKYSPGILLLLEMAREARGLGITLIDFGKGDAEYKQRLKTGEVALAEGTVETGRLAARLRRVILAAVSRLDRAPAAARPVASIPGRALRRLAVSRRFR
jgi:CelD/BcsL family acetyltransferase involved in cellulose biosynthesis